MQEESTDSQKTLESLVPDGVAAMDIPSATISNALRWADNFGLTQKVSVYGKRVQIWKRAEGASDTTAWSAWENHPKSARPQPSQSSSRSAPSSSSSRNADFWSRWLRNAPRTRPPLDD
jgi:hypothetical protein